MRQIKFRAWDKETKKMMMVGGITFNANGKFDNDLVVDNEEWLQIEKFGLMQFTGLKDKNGKEIWEGDILATKQIGVKNPMFVNHVKVSFSDGYISTDPGSGYEQFYGWIVGEEDPLNDSLLNTEDYVVVGNIYQNPDLLKE